MLQSILQLGLGVMIIIAVTYVMYMIGLSLVLRQLGYSGWVAFVPVYNYYHLIRAVGLPRRWFGLAIVPYAGTLYALAISVRLGKIYHRGVAFSSTWLTIGAPIGMFIIAFSKRGRDLSVIHEPPPKIDPKDLQKHLKKRPH